MCILIFSNRVIGGYCMAGLEQPCQAQVRILANTCTLKY